MSLARAFTRLQQAVLSHGRLPGKYHESWHLQTSLARFFANVGYLDRNQVTERIISSVKNFEKVDPKKVSTTTKFADLGLDSLDTVEMVMAMEEEFGVEIDDEDADRIHSIEEAVEFFANHPHAK